MHIIRSTVGASALRVCIVLMGLCAALTGASSLAIETPSAAQTLEPTAALRIVPGLEEPLVAMGPTTREEDAALATAIAAFRNPATAAADFTDSAKPFEAFLAAHPASAWRTAILTNLGLGYYHAGYFSRATLAWEQAWAAGRGATAAQPKALADRAFGELVRMHARVGHAKELEALFADAGDRAISGSATEMVTGAHEGLWMFRNDWGVAYLCGPKALQNLLAALKVEPDRIAALDKVRSGPHGFTFAQVSQLADEAGLQHRVVHRAPGQDVPVPSIVNWKVQHFAAIVGEQDGRYHLKDPTFGGGDLWVSKAAIDAESSGYFLVPAAQRSSLPWRTASAEEAGRAFGMGYTGTSQNGSTTPCDQKTGPAGGMGMCMASATSMVVSLSLSDTPVGYTPQKGPAAEIRLTYNQREAYQPAVFGFFNVGPKWTLNVLSYVQDNPSSPGSSVFRYVAGGGAVDYTINYSYNASTGAFSPERQGQAVLVRIPATGAVTSYELRMPDGSKQVFARPDGATSSPRRIFLTQIVDPQGNALTLNYDAQLRLASLTDATGRSTTFAYGAANALLVTRITDPFGRFASLAYDAGGRLASITDVIGITSSFAYDSGGLVNAMTTPYGTSRYSYGSGSDNSRFLEMTDPLGYTERVEFRHLAPGMPYADPVAPSGWNNDYLYYRNTFHWDKHVYPITHTDYTRARITHWLHNPAGQTSPIVESVKMPLERRVWLRYPNQSPTYYEGSTGTPIAIARVLDDNTTQARSFTYNSFGKPLTAVDPVGRRTVFAYAANGIDLVAVQQQTSTAGALSTIAAFTYNGQHLPLTYTDAAGQTTQYAYNAAGQLVSVTDALGQTTGYGYDGFGRLVSIVNANGATQRSFTYDGFDRVATSTDSEGYTLAYGYDALDRITEVRYPDGTTTQRSYDKLDLAASKDRLGRVTVYGHDANRQLTSVTDPLGQITEYGYHENGALASLTDPKGNTTRWDIDIQSRPTAKRYANGDTESYSYETSTSRLRALTDPMGQIKNYGYTLDDRTRATSYASATRPTPSVTFTYDAFFPRPTAMVDGIGTTAFQYHPVGAAGALQLAVEDGPYNNDTVAYQYDALGRVVTRTVDSAAETFAYDRLGRVAQHNSALGSFGRTYLGQTVQPTSQGNGVVGTTWSYDGNLNDRRLLGIGNSGQARSFGLATTPEDRITALTETIGSAPQKTWSYGYDALNRLTGAQASTGQNFSYAYDGADNLGVVNGVSVTYNAVNQIASFGGTAYSYDANGNLLDDGMRTYQWDAQDRLVGIGYKAQPGNATMFRYDGMGRRIGIVDTSSLGATETRYLWCDSQLCQARNASDTVTRRYFAEGFVIPQGGQSLYYATDQLGSVRDLLATQNGSKVAAFDYDAYGNSIGSSGRVASDFRYAGMFSHAQSGLGLTNYRAYDPRSARWLSRDPIGETGGLNLYGYVGGNPASYTDVTGQCPICLIFLVEAAIGGGIDLGIQLYNNGGRLDCVNWWEVAGWAAGSGVGGVALQTVTKALLAARAARTAEVAAEGAAPFSHLVPGGGLAAHEAAGGHLLARHVGQAEADLAARLAAQPRLSAASTFASRAEAEVAISGALDARAADVSAWVAAGARGRLVIDAAFSGGSVLQRGAAAAVPGTGVRAVLEGTGGGGWRIITGYPTP